MNVAVQKELVRLLELDYEKSTKLIEGIVSSGFTIRGWGVALTSALIGLAVQSRLWPVAAFTAVITVLLALIDGYHSWLYARAFDHAQAIERVLGSYYESLSRGGDDPKAREDFEVNLLAHRFGRFAEIERFRLSALRAARPRLVIVTLYATLFTCAVGAAVLVASGYKQSVRALECTAVANQPNVYVCTAK